MKELIHKLNNNPKYSRLFQWGKMISITGSAQMVVQATGLLTGILIIRMLPTKEYAYYTIANTMLATMTLLADGGISSGVMAKGGKIWKDKKQLGQVLATGLDLRKKFAVFSLIIAVPILVYLLKHQGANLWTIVFIVAALIPSFFAALSDSLLEIIPRLHQDIKMLQGNQLLVSVLRLILSVASVVFFPFTFVALIANGIPRIYGNSRLKIITYQFAEKEMAPDPQIRADILKIVKRTLPGAIYYSLSGQITIWLMSVMGTTSSIAQVGALGRLSMVLTIFTVMFSTLITPRFARFEDNRKLLISNFLKIFCGLVILCFFIVGIVYAFPNQLLWILGKGYGNLSTALVLSVIGSCLSLISGSVFTLSTSRGWIINPLFTIPLNVLALVLGILFLDISTLNGILFLNIFMAAAQIAMLVVFFFVKALKSNN